LNNIRTALAMLLVLMSGAPALEALPLWEIQGTANRIQLLGSIHFLRPDDYPLPAAISRAYDQADVLVMEVDLANLDPLKAQTVMQRLAIDPDGRSLQDALGARSFSAARTRAAALDIDLTGMQPYEPWFAALQITQLRLIQLGFEPGFGIEARLLQRAARDGKDIVGLETLEEQLSTLDSLPERAQHAFLLQTLEEAAEVELILNDVVRAWRNGDTPTLERELLTGMKDQPDLYQSVLVSRNRNWTEQIAGFARERKNYLIVVGTLHLVGEDSVLEMLEAAGYASRQIR
jgi:uncharacterized protein YbaP (TraB family)